MSAVYEVLVDWLTEQGKIPRLVTPYTLMRAGNAAGGTAAALALEFERTGHETLYGPFSPEKIEQSLIYARGRDLGPRPRAFELEHLRELCSWHVQAIRSWGAWATRLELPSALQPGDLVTLAVPEGWSGPRDFLEFVNGAGPRVARVERRGAAPVRYVLPTRSMQAGVISLLLPQEGRDVEGWLRAIAAHARTRGIDYPPRPDGWQVRRRKTSATMEVAILCRRYPGSFPPRPKSSTTTISPS